MTVAVNINGLIIGMGILVWPSSERRSDRYGFVGLMSTLEHETYLNPDTFPLDAHGKLVAVVTQTRKSDHIGDIYHGIVPETPYFGEEIELGEGTLKRISSDYGGDLVGLSPDDGRETWWLDPHKLYRAIHQTVVLVFRETPRANV